MISAFSRSISGSFKVSVASNAVAVRSSSARFRCKIAEAWAKRLYPKHFGSKLTDADGEQMESQHWLIEAKDCN